MLLPAAGASAQEAIKVGVCNPAKVFEGMDERKVIEDRMKASAIRPSRRSPAASRKLKTSSDSATS